MNATKRTVLLAFAYLTAFTTEGRPRNSRGYLVVTLREPEGVS